MQFVRQKPEMKFSFEKSFLVGSQIFSDQHRGGGRAGGHEFCLGQITKFIITGTPLMRAVESTNSLVVQLLLNLGANVHLENKV